RLLLGNGKTFTMYVSTFPFLRNKQFIRAWIVDHANDNFAFMSKCDRYTIVRKAVDIVRCPVNGVNNPQVLCILRTSNRLRGCLCAWFNAFFSEKSMLWKVCTN